MSEKEGFPVSPPLPVWRCPRMECLPLDAIGWSEVPVFSLLETASGLVPRQATHVQVAWTAEDLHVRFRCEDAQPWATHTERDAPLYEEEVVEVFLDPVGDGQGYFEIEVNPLNAVLDLVLRRNRSGYLKDFSWQCAGLRTEARIEGPGWTAALAIPLLSLTPELPPIGTRWRANFFRIDRPPGLPRELSAGSPTGRPLFHVPERFGWLEFAGEQPPTNGNFPVLHQ